MWWWIRVDDFHLPGFPASGGNEPEWGSCCDASNHPLPTDLLRSRLCLVTSTLLFPLADNSSGSLTGEDSCHVFRPCGMTTTWGVELSALRGGDGVKGSFDSAIEHRANITTSPTAVAAVLLTLVEWQLGSSDYQDLRGVTSRGRTG